MKFRHCICWIRRDLRLSDHRALYEACRSSDLVTVVFVYDTLLLNSLENRNDRRVNFIHQSLQEIDRKLSEKESALVTLHGDPREEIPRLAERLSADSVFCNRDYEPSAKTRDETISDRLNSKGIRFQTFKDQVLFEGLEVATKSGGPFRVFTPFKNAWVKRFLEEDIPDFRPNLKKLTPKRFLRNVLCQRSLKDIGFKKNDLWLEPGEKAGKKRLKRFLRAMEKYDTQRNLQVTGGTSGLSAYLRFGNLSIRKLFKAARGDPSEGARVWLSELVWREFYQMILDRFPKVESHSFLPQYDGLKWPGTVSYFNAWKEGRTGFPLVDAAMRHLIKTGWMHNRLRMVVASFLVKDLLVDWRKGEAVFARRLLDFDLAANNGGWQWCASTGCDAQPWFRIFNPITQSKRFDPEGKFIRNLLPELAGFSNKDIHFPATTSAEIQKKAKCLVGLDYPMPIIDHAIQRERFLELFKNHLKA